MKKFIKEKLNEDLLKSYFRLPKNIDISDEDLLKIKNINWRDIKINDNGGEGNIAHLSVSFPFKTNISEGIVIDIQVIKDTIYQIHLSMVKELQGIGLGYKIYKALINDLGHLYSGKGRRLNSVVNNIWVKLKKDNDFYCISNENGDLCMIKNNPDKNNLAKFIEK